MRAGAAAWMLAGLAGLAPAGAGAFPDGAPPGHTGGFGEPTCGECHFGGLPEAGGERLSLEGLPATYRTGTTYEIELVLDLAGKSVGGVQLSTRFQDGPLQGLAAGRLTPADERLQRITDSGAPNLGHRQPARPAASGGTDRWRLRWTSPDENHGPAVFHAAAVAGDDDRSPLGDDVLVLERRLPAEPATDR